MNCKASNVAPLGSGLVWSMRNSFKETIRFGSVSLASNQIDMIIMQGRTCKKSPVRVECRARNRRRAVVMEEARVRFVARKQGPVDVESLDLVPVCATLYSKLVLG